MWWDGGGGVSTGKQCKPLFSTYHPLGSQRRRHASATSSLPVTSHIKAGDFSSAPARMLFLPRLWVGLLARRVPGCAVIIPQVFGWREGPSHLCQNGVRTRRAWAFLRCVCVREAKTSLSTLAFTSRCVCFFSC